MKQSFIRLVSLVLALTVFISVVPLLDMKAEAASLPGFSSSAYCEVIAPAKINVYRDSNLRTRGSSSPAKSYNSCIYAGDVCKVYRITNGYMEVAFPTSSGYKTGFIKPSDLISCVTPSEQVTSRGKATTYRSPGGSSIGYAEPGDAVFKLFTSGSYYGIIYTAKNSSGRAYKFGYVKITDYNNVICATTKNGVVYNEKTVTYDCSSTEAWIASVIKQEGNLGGVVLAQTVKSWKTITVQVPIGPSFNGKSTYRTDTLRLPYQVTYRLHTHERKMGVVHNTRYEDGKIVVMYRCDCGYVRDMISWEIPLPDTSDAQTAKSVISRLPQIN